MTPVPPLSSTKRPLSELIPDPSPTMGGIDGSCSRNAIYYGIPIQYIYIHRATETYRVVGAALTTLNILAAPRNLQQGVTSRIPEEIWQAIKLCLVHEHMDRLEENARLGMGRSCGADKSAEPLVPKDQWSCQSRNEKCEKCLQYLTYGFLIQDNFPLIRKQMLGHYHLFKSEVERSCLVASVTPSQEAYDYFGLAAHPPVSRRLLINNQFVGNEYDHGDYSHSPFLHPVVDIASARVQFAAFIRDYKIQVSTVPIYDRKTDKRERRRALKDAGTATREELRQLDEELDGEGGYSDGFGDFTGSDSDNESEELSNEEIDSQAELLQELDEEQVEGGRGSVGLEEFKGSESDTGSDRLSEEDDDDQAELLRSGSSFINSWDAEEKKQKQQRKEDHKSLLRDFPPGEPQWLLVGMLC